MKAPGPTAVSDEPLDRTAAERRQRLVDGGCALRELGPGRQLAEGAQRGLLAARPVERAHAARLEGEREQSVELAGVALFQLRAVGEHVEEVVEQIRVVAPAERRAHGLDLGARDLELLALQEDRRHASASSPRIACSSCSKPPVSIEQCIPHSFGASVSHHQRPARVGSSGPIARVHGAQPIDV